jgi:ectoine hydroxylase-related dioxygenase (phytanoyl-CoA dioxygenase family)
MVGRNNRRVWGWRYIEKGMNILDHGYSIESPVLFAGECDALLGTLEKATRTGRAGMRHLMSHRAVRELANDERLLRIARLALGGAAVPFRATFFAKSQEANWLIPWHQDTALPLAARFDDPQWVSWSLKAGVFYAHAPAWALSRIVALRVHLDASTRENGPLRVVERSHLIGVLTDQSVSDHVAKHRQTTCLVPRGGVLVMRPLLIHSSSKAKTGEPRRVIHIEYAYSLDLKAGLRLAIA